MKHLYLLWQKDVKTLINAYFQTPKQIMKTLAVLLLILGLTGLLVNAFRRWFHTLMDSFSPEAVLVSTPLLFFLILSWLSILIFVAVFVDCRQKFFHTADLEFLMATPVKPSIIFSYRFVNFILFSSSIIIQLLLFGFAPLIALGLVLSAPWYYYVFLLPITYSYLSIPAALGLVLIITLLRFISPKKLFKIAGVLHLSVTGVWLYFVFGSQEEILTFFLEHLAGRDWLIHILRPLSAGAELLIGFLGFEANLGRSILELGLFVVLIFALAVFIIQKIYYPAYDRILSSTHGKKQIKAPGREKVLSLVSAHWRIAFRNYEMAQGALGMLAIFVVYIVIIRSISLEHTAILFLLNLAVSGFVCSWVSYLLFVPPAILTDNQAPKKQFWLLKVSPYPSREVVRSFWTIYFIPQIPSGLLLLAVAHWITGLSWSLFPPALIIFLLMQGAMNSIEVLAVFLEFVQTSETPVLHKFLREFSPLLISLLFLFFLGLGELYQSVPFLRFLHSLQKGYVSALGIAIALMILLICGIKGITIAEKCWERFQL